MLMVYCKKERLLREHDNKKGTVEINFTAHKRVLWLNVCQKLRQNSDSENFACPGFATYRCIFLFPGKNPSFLSSFVINYLFSSLSQTKKSFICISPCFGLGEDKTR